MTRIPQPAHNDCMTISHDSETPAHGQQVISVCGFITYDFNGVTKLFLAKRADTKKFLPGLYELPGGHVDFGEDIVEGLKREITEEFGMTVSVGDPFSVFTYLNEVKGSHSIQVTYFAKFNEPIDQIKLNPEDHSEYGWFTRDEALAKKRGKDDEEYQAILRGFNLLAGEQIDFGRIQ